MSLETRQLRSFVAVAEEGQVTRAARRLYLAQPALTQAIAKLETQVGVSLLERHPRGVRLTDAGHVFLAKARVATAAVDAVESTAEALQRAARTSLAWGFVGSPPMLQAPELFSAFMRARPDADVTFRDLALPGGSMSAWLGPVDVALCYFPSADSDVETLVIGEERRVAIVPAGHPLAACEAVKVENLLDETFCGYDPSIDREHAGFWTLDDHRGGLPPNLTTDRAANPQETLASVATGRAIAISTARDAATVVRLCDSIRVLAIEDVQPALLTLVWDKDGPSEIVRSLVEVARTVTGAES